MNITFILVEPAVPENIGASARAIKTMGFSDLRLVNPCNHLSPKARMLAHGSNEILEKAELFNSLSEAIVPFDLVIATSARPHWVKQDIIPAEKLSRFLAEKEDTIHNIAIVFGREESGLSNEEMALCHCTTTLPMKTRYPSLNLGQSVMLFAYLLARLELPTAETNSKAPEQSFSVLYKRVQSILTSVGIAPSRLIHGRIMERLSGLNAGDIKLLHSITVALEKKLRNR